MGPGVSSPGGQGLAHVTHMHQSPGLVVVPFCTGFRTSKRRVVLPASQSCCGDQCIERGDRAAHSELLPQRDACYSPFLFHGSYVQ